jgi:hypothetical protein
MHKFTSLEEGAEIGSDPRGVAEVVGGPENSGKAPLDPRAFAGEGVPSAVINDRHEKSAGTRKKESAAGRASTVPSTPASKKKKATPEAKPAPPSSPDIGSLSQMLEPDRGVIAKGATVADPPPRNNTRTIVIGLVLVGLIAAGVFIFKDQIFGGSTPQSPPAAPSGH